MNLRIYKSLFSLLLGLVILFPAYCQDSLVCIPSPAARYYLEANEERWVLREKDSLSTQKISSLTEEILLKDQKIVTYENDLKSYEIREVTLEAVSTLKDQELETSRAEVRKQKILKYLAILGIIVMAVL